MKKLYVFGLGLAASAVVIGCGGGGSSAATTGSTATAAGTATLTGTVPGTFIEAFCDNGTYVSTNSVQNGTSQHPFALNVPTNTPCRLAMTTHENDPAQRVTSPVTVNGKQAIVLTGNTDLGYVDLPATYAQASDANGDHVEDHAIDVAPASLSGNVVDDTAQNPFDKNHNGKVDGLEDTNHNHKADEWDQHDAKSSSGHQNDQSGNHDTTHQNDQGGNHDTTHQNDQRGNHDASGNNNGGSNDNGANHG